MVILLHGYLLLWRETITDKIHKLYSLKSRLLTQVETETQWGCVLLLDHLKSCDLEMQACLLTPEDWKLNPHSTHWVIMLHVIWLWSCDVTGNFSDWFLYVFVQPSKESRWFPAVVFSRLVFIPLVMLCNVQDSKLTAVFRHDSAFVVIMALFAFSNGYLASLCMAYAPQWVLNRPQFKKNPSIGYKLLFNDVT